MSEGSQACQADLDPIRGSPYGPAASDTTGCTNRPDRRQHLTTGTEPFKEMLALSGASIDDILTNIPSIHALTAWRRYNAGAVVEHRIEELIQLSTGKTAVNDLGGNALLWGLSAVTYQTLHTLRRHCLNGSWRTAQPKRIRLWMIRLPAKLTTHGRKVYLQMLRDEPVRLRTLAALRGLNHDLPPPAPA